MFKLSVPIYNRTVIADTREVFLRQLRDAGAERIFLIPLFNVNDGTVTDYESVCENVAYFQSEGFEVGLWVGHTIGHGGLVGDDAAEQASRITPLRNLAGEDIPDTRCPFDKNMQASVATLMEKFATTGATILLIDDDFRLSQHGKEFCCVCELHMARICEILGEQITREELRARAFVGGPNRYRDAFIAAQRDSLLELARVMRAAVDRVDKKIGLALCHAHALLDIDGAEPLEITEIFRGEHTPLLRLHGAPYWSAINTEKPLVTTLEKSRMFSALSKKDGVETMTECDTYPRPRHRTPASYMELHDAAMRADHMADGTLKYMFDYVSGPLYETGYVKAHCRDLPLLRGLEKLFESGRQVGVRVCVSKHLLKDSDCDLVSPRDTSPDPTAGILLALNSIPTTYTEKGLCRAVFGNNVRELAGDLSGGLLLDAAAALLLTEQGHDVGLAPAAGRELLRSVAPAYIHSKTERALITKSDCRLLDAPVADGAEVLLWVALGERLAPLLYRYENSKGERFLVFLHVGESVKYNSGIIRGYLQQAALHEGLAWLCGAALPVTCTGNPELYVMCREGEDHLTVGLFNCFADPIDAPTLTLQNAYTGAEFLGTGGKLSGNTLTLDPLPAFSFSAVKLKK